ncbi:hypothetical protein K9N50_04610 [bacterium]|nr:hypothetical protein [bacterium]
MKKKDFDCVQMKQDIQNKILRETKGMTPEEIEKYTIRKIESNPILLKVWQKRKRTDPESVSKESLSVK